MFKAMSTQRRAHIQDKPWKGTHNGDVSGKPFERSRRSRKPHSMRRSQIIQRSLDIERGRGKVGKV